MAQSRRRLFFTVVILNLICRSLVLSDLNQRSFVDDEDEALVVRKERQVNSAGFNSLVNVVDFFLKGYVVTSPNASVSNYTTVSITPAFWTTFFNILQASFASSDSNTFTSLLRWTNVCRSYCVNFASNAALHDVKCLWNSAREFSGFNSSTCKEHGILVSLIENLDLSLQSTAIDTGRVWATSCKVYEVWTWHQCLFDM